MNGIYAHTISVCVSLPWSGGLRVVRLRGNLINIQLVSSLGVTERKTARWTSCRYLRDIKCAYDTLVTLGSMAIPVLSLSLFARQNHGLEQSARGLWLCLLPPGHQFLSSPASPNPFSTTSFPTPTLPAVHPLNKSAIFFRLIDQLTVALEKKKYKIGCRGRQPPL